MPLPCWSFILAGKARLCRLYENMPWWAGAGWGGQMRLVAYLTGLAVALLRLLARERMVRQLCLRNVHSLLLD